MRQQDFNHNIYDITNRFQFYTTLLIFSILLPVLFGPISMLVYLIYIIFIALEDVGNNRVYRSYSLDTMSREVDKIIENIDVNEVEMIFNDDGEAISGEHLERVKKLERIID